MSRETWMTKAIRETRLDNWGDEITEMTGVTRMTRVMR